MYALFEETEMGDIERTREVYKACLEIIPHKKVTKIDNILTPQ